MLPKLPCRLFTDQLPSTSASQLLRAIRKVDVISAMVTSVQSHSLLERLFIYPYFRHYYGYFLLDKRTNQMIGIDCGDFSVSKYHIERLKLEENANLTHLFITHGHEKHSQGYISLQNAYPQVEIRSFSLPNTIKTAEGDMSFIGDLCVFPLHTPGHSEDSLTYVVTEVNDKSTKTPLVFSGDTLQIGSIGTVADAGEIGCMIGLY